MFRSIRHGLFAALAGFAVLICICYTGLALVIAYVTEDMLVERLLQREAAAVSAHFDRHGDIKPPADDLIRAHTRIETLPPAARSQAMAGARRAEIFTQTGHHYHLRALDLGAGPGAQRVWLLADVAPLLVVSKLIQDVGGVLIFVALGLIGLALLLAWLLARRLVSPLQTLAHEVRQVRPGAQVALGARERRDEIGYLAERLGATFEELHAALAREHAFTRDVSHELRTPLTVMKNTLAQAVPHPDVAQLQAEIAQMSATIEVLFALARAEQVAHAPFELRGCIEESLLRLVDGQDLVDDWLVLDLPDRLEVVGNRHLALLLLNNCLGNALFHGGPGTRLRLSFTDGVLGIANTVDADRTGQVQGFLHGQNLLGRIAAAMDWTLDFHAGGAAYRVDIVPLRSV
ncbi:hypothetical protein SOM61_18775 [Massilia sp. CFBP9012]|uniref:sensor histidine kinase n=1 Tax=Massilia sp. CFBP9012 TaxID=3096531 RepID=UPI002A6B0076|nr:histidine kinase dimerization/phospho-acceptor domain-containing protein [Massilia sp. CFBP9012]MDY0977013.1 hypothetical protein [Massilia sp. CFBP9012]